MCATWIAHSRSSAQGISFGDNQSAFAPGGLDAERLLTLSNVMFIGAALIFLLVMVLTWIAIRRRPAWLARRSTIVVGGIIFPVVTLTILLVYGLTVARALVRTDTPAPLRIEVTGEQFWWRVHYLDESGGVAAVSANEIRIPTGVNVELVLIAGDVIHSFWVPALAGKLDMIPGHRNSFRMRADRAGVYRGQCAEYCGAQHANMAFYVVAMAPGAFEAWMRREREPARAPATPLLQQGLDSFQSSGCGACHAIRGTGANGQSGPDLTHVGSRISIGAGMFPNNNGTLAGWISSSQHLKPGNYMPSFDVLTGEELRAMAAYLESLQ